MIMFTLNIMFDTREISLEAEYSCVNYIFVLCSEFKNKKTFPNE